MGGYNVDPTLASILAEAESRLSNLERTLLTGLGKARLDAQWSPVTDYQGAWEAGSIDPAQYLYKGGFVYLTGTVRASAAAGEDVFILPEGCRPGNGQQEPVIPVVAGGALKILRVEESGLVSLIGGATLNQVIVFSGTMFPVRV